MVSILLCVLSFLICFIAGRRSLVAGLAAALTIGYFYGITRANFTGGLSHFIFDAGVMALYITQLTRRLNLAQRKHIHKTRLWVLFLMIWPALLFLIPAQDSLVELVGLRGNIFLLPFLIMGARLENEELYKLSLWVAGLNLLVFGLAVTEFVMGIQTFFPKNEVTKIIYMGNDIADHTAYRIPASFTSAHAYAGTMVMTIPLLVGAWVQKSRLNWHRYLLVAALGASMLGVFMSGARVHTIVLFSLLLVITFFVTFSGQLKLVSSLGWILMLAGVFWIVSNEGRLQRFMTLQDTDYVEARISISVNKGFIDRAIEYPLGNGLGGGGTSLPYFLQDRVKRPMIIENEYGRIMLEQGIPGLLLWIAFITWVFIRRITAPSDPWALGRRLAWFVCAAYFVTGVIGLGLLTSIPQTCLMLLLTGWITVRQPVNADKTVRIPHRLANERQVLAQ